MLRKEHAALYGLGKIFYLLLTYLPWFLSLVMRKDGQNRARIYIYTYIFIYDDPANICILYLAL